LKDADTVQKYNGADFVPVGGLIATKSVLKTNTFSASLGAGARTAITDLSITHTLQNASNKLLLTADLGVLANSGGRSQTGICFAVNGASVAVGDADGSRSQVFAGGRVPVNSANYVVASRSISLL